MQMPPYPVLCSAVGCGQLAQFKIAAAWSDGITHELKTYCLACEPCLPHLLARAHVKQAACRLAAGESLGDPGVYELHRDMRDRELVRRPDLEIKD